MNLANSEYKKAFCEVLYILEHMEEKCLERVPPKLLSFFEDNKSKYYKVNLSTKLPLEEQELLEETKAILAFLCRKYLCDDETKEKLEEKFQLELKKTEES